MPRTLTNDMNIDLLRPNSGGAWLWLCEIAVSGYDTRRYTDNNEDVVYPDGGDTFSKNSLRVGQQEFNSDGDIPQVILQTSNIKRAMEDLVNETQGLLDGEIKVIKVNSKHLATEISALEADWEVLASQSDEDWVTFTLGVPNLLTQRFPLRQVSSSLCPWSDPEYFKGVHCQYAGGDSTCTGTYEDCLSKSNEEHYAGEIGLSPNLMEA